MLKKSFGSIALVILLATLITVGCQQPNDTYEIAPSIAAPTNVRATAVEGVIQVAWDPSKDANIYYLYRRAYAGNDYHDVQRGVYGKGQDLTFEDIVAFDNQLVHNAEYEYIVIASVGDSTTYPSIDSATRKVNYAFTDVIANAEARSNRVRANIPSRINEDGTRYKLPIKAEEIKVDGFLSNGTGIDQYGNPTYNLVSDQGNGLKYDDYGTILVSYLKKPGWRYEVAYSFTNEDYNTFIYKEQNYRNGDGWAVDAWGYHELPANFMNREFDQVEVRARFATDYYLPSDPVAEKLGAIANLRPAFKGNPVLGVVAKYGYDSNGVLQGSNGTSSSPYTELTWNEPAEDIKSYTIYRADADAITGAKQLTSKWDLVETITDMAKYRYYRDIRPATVSYDALGKEISRTGNTYFFYNDTDEDLANGKSYVYVLVVETAQGAKNNFSSSLVTFNNVPNITDANTFRNSNIDTVDVTLTSAESRRRIQWHFLQGGTAANSNVNNIITGVTYKVYRGTVTSVLHYVSDDGVVTYDWTKPNNPQIAWEEVISYTTRSPTDNTAQTNGNVNGSANGGNGNQISTDATVETIDGIYGVAYDYKGLSQYYRSGTFIVYKVEATKDFPGVGELTVGPSKYRKAMYLTEAPYVPHSNLTLTSSRGQNLVYYPNRDHQVLHLGTNEYLGDVDGSAAKHVEIWARKNATGQYYKLPGFFSAQLNNGNGTLRHPGNVTSHTHVENAFIGSQVANKIELIITNPTDLPSAGVTDYKAILVYNGADYDDNRNTGTELKANWRYDTYALNGGRYGDLSYGLSQGKQFVGGDTQGSNPIERYESYSGTKDNYINVTRTSSGTTTTFTITSISNDIYNNNMDGEVLTFYNPVPVTGGWSWSGRFSITSGLSGTRFLRWEDDGRNSRVRPGTNLNPVLTYNTSGVELNNEGTTANPVYVLYGGQGFNTSRYIVNLTRN